MAFDLIKKELYEIHKPSQFISCKYYQLINDGRKQKEVFYKFSPTQHDTLNYLFWNARKELHTKIGEDKLNSMVLEMSDNEFEDFFRNQRLTLNMNELGSFLGKYDEKENRHNLLQLITSLQNVLVTTNYLKKGKTVQSTFPLIAKVKKITDTNTKHTEYEYRMEPEILLSFAYKSDQPFAKLMLKIQTELTTTHTKILYEICKDYQNMGTITKPLDQWVISLNFDTNLKSAQQVGLLKRDYLNKSIKEINTKTDINIKKIFGKKKDGVKMMTVEFEKQESEYVKELVKDVVVTPEITEDNLHEILIETKIREIVEMKYQQAIDKGMDIKSEEGLKHHYRQQIVRDEIEAIVEIDKWIEDEFYDADEFKGYLTNLSEYLSKKKGENVYVTMEEYKIYDVLSQKDVTRTPFETVDVFSEFNESIT